MTQRPKIHITRHSSRHTIFTIGHSNKILDDFLQRLADYGIECVIDVRTKPYSRWCPHFSRNSLARSLWEAGIEYEFRGDGLGGLTENVDYDKNIQEVATMAEGRKVALLCSEGDFRKCHRYTVLTPDLEKLGIQVEHIGYENGRDVTR